MKLFVATASPLSRGSDVVKVNGVSYVIEPHEVHRGPVSMESPPEALWTPFIHLQISSLHAKMDHRADLHRADLHRALRKAMDSGVPVEDAFDCLNDVYVVESVMSV